MSLTSRIAATVLVLLLGGLVLACDLIDPSGEVATARLCVDPGPDPSVQDLLMAEAARARYAAQTESRSVMQAVIAQLDLDEDTESLRGRISVKASEDELLLTIEVRDEDPRAARALALGLGAEMIERVRHAQTQSVPEGIPDHIRDEIHERFSQDLGDDPDPLERPLVVRNLLVWCEKPAGPAPSGPDD